MTGPQLQQAARDAAAALENVTRGRPFTPHLDVWKVAGRVFLILTDDDADLQIATVKAEPDRGDALRRDHDTITPGRHLDKRHWISVAPARRISEQMVEDLVIDSCDLVAGRSRARSAARPGAR